jgi:hypothetical protein
MANSAKEQSRNFGLGKGVPFAPAKLCTIGRWGSMHKSPKC